MSVIASTVVGVVLGVNPNNRIQGQFQISEFFYFVANSVLEEIFLFCCLFILDWNILFCIAFYSRNSDNNAITDIRKDSASVVTVFCDYLAHHRVEKIL